MYFNATFHVKIAILVSFVKKEIVKNVSSTDTGGKRGRPENFILVEG